MDLRTCAAVRIGGRTLLWDPGRGWTAAKIAELFPSIARRLVPSDYVIEGGRLRAARAELSGLWWR